MEKLGQAELDEQKQKQMVNENPDGVELGGLYHGIDDVASNVTYTKDDQKIIGKRPSYSGKMSLKDYETISVQSDLKSQVDSHQQLNFLQLPNKNGEVLLSSDKGAHEMIAIKETEGFEAEESLSTAKLSSMLRARKASSPERIIKQPGTDNQIRDMVSASHELQIMIGGSDT